MRLAAVAALAGMAAAGVLGWSPTATAGMPDRVSFTGGCGAFASGIGGKAVPDTSRITVPAGSEVTFANHLSEPATLHLDGEAVADVAPGAAVEVTFHTGPVTAVMQINCLVGKPSGTVTVEVSGGTSRPNPPSAPPSSPASGGGTPGGAPGSSGSGSGGSGTTGGAATDPAGPAPAGSVPDGSAPAGPAPGWSAPTGPTGGGAWPGGPPPASPPRPAGGAEAGEPQGAGWDDPADGGGRPDAPATVDEQAVDDRVGAEQLTRTADSAPGGEPIGLLALIATVCVVGVSAGAVRTILTQRANRAEWA